MLPRDTESPAQALRWLRGGECFDLAILDMHMPEMDGVALAQRDPGGARPALPLVLFSSLGRRDGRPRPTACSAPTLAKPLRQSQLCSTR